MLSGCRYGCIISSVLVVREAANKGEDFESASQFRHGLCSLFFTSDLFCPVKSRHSRVKVPDRIRFEKVRFQGVPRGSKAQKSINFQYAFGSLPKPSHVPVLTVQSEK